MLGVSMSCGSRDISTLTFQSGHKIGYKMFLAIFFFFISDSCIITTASQADIFRIIFHSLTLIFHSQLVLTTAFFFIIFLIFFPFGPHQYCPHLCLK